MKARLIPTFAYVLALLFIGAGSETGFAQTSPRVAPKVLESIASDGRARVLVELAVPDRHRGLSRRSAANQRERRAEIAAKRQDLLAALGKGGHRVVHEFAHTPYVALDIDAATLAKLQAASSVAVRVVEDPLLKASLAYSVPRMDADRAHLVGLDGAGTAVAVIDSGVDITHPFFASRLVEEACFATAESGSGGDCPNGQATQIGSGAAANCTFATQACRHGTHVAGIAVGDGADFSGVAPAASLIAVQVFHASTQCQVPFEAVPCARAFGSDIVAGLEHVYDLRDQYNIASVNLSLGGAAYGSACDTESPLFAAAINNLRSVGIATIAASGNDALTTGISEPACVSAAISVGATDAADDVAWFSNASDDLDLLAPGTPITSSVVGGGFDTLAGTSMAAPHVAGAWALYKQAFPTATIDDTLASFIATGVPIADWRGGPTKPSIRVGAAMGVESPVPVLVSVSPTEIARFGPDFTLTVDGSNFLSFSQIYVDGVPQPTTYVDFTRLTATVPSEVIDTTNSSLTVTVYTPPLGGGTSSAASIDLLDSSVDVDATVVTAGDVVNATAINPPGWQDDWLGLALVGSPTNSYIDYVYIGDDPNWSIAMPQTPGQYEFRLFVKGGFTQVGVSPPITVEAIDPEPLNTTLTPSTTNAAPGDAVTVTLADAPGGASDWLALAEVGAPATSYISYVYVGAGVTDYTWTVNMPQTPGQYEFRLFVGGGFTQLTASAAITVDESASGDTTLTPSTTSAGPGDAVTVTLENAPGGASDWLALAEVGAPATSYVTYVYVGAGVTDRTWTVNMPQRSGDFEFRLFIDGGYTQLTASAPVTVEEPAPENTTLTPSTTSAAPGDAVTVTLADAPGGASDWLALAQVGAPATSYVTYVYVGAGVTDRTWTVDMPQTPGDYEFRLFIDGGYTQLTASVPVTVEQPAAGNTTLTPSVTNAAPGEAVTVTLENAPGGASDWLALAQVGAPATNYITYVYVGAGVTDYTWSVNMPQTSGDYEFRLFIDGGYTQVAASAPVTVVEPDPEPLNTTLTPSTTSAAPGEAVTVTLADAPGGASDWLALAQVGAPATNYVAYVYVGAGVTDFTWAVDMPQTPGDYEFRLFIDGGYTQLAASAPITVEEPAPEPLITTLTPSTTTAAPGESVTVTLENAPGGSGDWLALAQVGASASSYVTYTYVGGGVTERTWTVFMPQAPGAYEFRLFENHGYTELAASDPVTVQ